MQSTDYSSAAYSSASDTEGEMDEESVRELFSPSLSRSAAPLDREWTVYADRVSGSLSKEEYLSSLKQVFRFRTLLEFSERCESHRVSKLLSEGDVVLRVFQTGVAPIWEAPENRAGGKFVVSLVGRDGERAERAWTTLVAVMCSGRLGAGPEQLCGCANFR